MKRVLPCLCFVILAFATSLHAQDAVQEARVAQLLTRVDEGDVESAWLVGEQLSETGGVALASLQQAARDASPVKKLALAYAILERGEPRGAIDMLCALTQSADLPPSVRCSAAALLGQRPVDLASWRLHELLRDKQLPDPVRVEVAKSLWKLTHGGQAFEALVEMARNSVSERARAEAAIALGGSGRFELVQKQIEELAKRPGQFGERAQAVLELNRKLDEDMDDPDLPPFPARLISEIVAKVRRYSAPDQVLQAVTDELEKLAQTAGPLGDEARMLQRISPKVNSQLGKAHFPETLIAEVVQKVRHLYAPDETDAREAEQLTTRHLANAAASAMLNSVDPFNDYLDEESLREMEEQLHSSYGGIGAWVGMRNGYFTILTPMYNKPAYKAGLCSMDMVESIDGVEVKEMKLNEVINLLKGPAGTQVRLKVLRKGFTEPREFVVTRDTIDLPSVTWQTLPGNIGYIRLSSFNDGNDEARIKGTTDLLEQALLQFRDQKTSGIVLDLTNNPGGLLQVAVEVSRKFLGPGKLIVYSQGKPGVYRREDKKTGSGPALYEGPLVVMVNSGSASASEIVAGALHDHKRAALVGEKTYGKGSVQQLIPLTTTRGLTRVKLTIAKYYLPSGKCIHGPGKPSGGIMPDVVVGDDKLAPGEADARWKIRDERALDEWVADYFNRHEAKLRQLLTFDGFTHEDYPEFDTLYAMVSEKYPDLTLTPDIVRKELRFALRRYLENNRGEDLLVDLEENRILQHALLKLGELMPGGLPNTPIYQALRQHIQTTNPEVAAKLVPETSPAK